MRARRARVQGSKEVDPAGEPRRGGRWPPGAGGSRRTPGETSLPDPFRTQLNGPARSEDDPPEDSEPERVLELERHLSGRRDVAEVLEVPRRLEDEEGLLSVPVDEPQPALE